MSSASSSSQSWPIASSLLPAWKASQNLALVVLLGLLPACHDSNSSSSATPPSPSPNPKPNVIQISGNTGVPGATLAYNGATAQGSVSTDGAGAYSFQVPANWAGTVTPTRAACSRMAAW